MTQEIWSFTFKKIIKTTKIPINNIKLFTVSSFSRITIPKMI